MLNSNNERAYSRISTLTLAVLFSVAGLGQPAAQTQSPWAGSFDERFADQGRVAPTFIRPEVMNGLASAVKKLVISPAEAETSPTSPPNDMPQPSEPRKTAAKAPPSQTMVTWRLPVARLITSNHLNRP